MNRAQRFFRMAGHYFHSTIGLLKLFMTDRQFLYLSCVLVGISSALAVTVLKTFAHSVFQFTQYVNGVLRLPYINSILPIIGILLTVLVIKKFLDGSIEKGTAQIMISVAKRSGFMPKKQMYAQIITSSLTVGMGGSAGLESPITITGAAFGSNYAQEFRLNYKERTLLLACGVAAGIASAFNAPIAGVLFAIEVILADLSVTAFIPIMISSATGAIMANLTMKSSILLSFKQHLDFDYHNTFYYVILGVLAGFLSVYHAHLFRKVEHSMGSYSNNLYKRALLGAGLLGVLIFLFPTLFGEGYESIKLLADDNASEIMKNSLFRHIRDNEWIVLLFVLFTVLMKSVATGLTLGSGGNGGNFAPSLFVGSYLGYLFAKVISLLGIKNLPLENFTVVGMAALLSGLFHAPLTAIFLIAEITGGYGLIVPLMLVSSISFAIAKRYDKYSMDIYTIADKGIVFTSDKDQNILNRIEVGLIYKSFIKTISPKASLDDVRDIIKSTAQDFIPVVDEKGKIKGVITLDSLRKILFENYFVYADIESYISNVLIYSIDENAGKILEGMDESKEDYAFIERNGIFQGYITKTMILEVYRLKLKNLRIE